MCNDVINFALITRGLTRGRSLATQKHTRSNGPLDGVASPASNSINPCASRFKVVDLIANQYEFRMHSSGPVRHNQNKWVLTISNKTRLSTETTCFAFFISLSMKPSMPIGDGVMRCDELRLPVLHTQIDFGWKRNWVAIQICRAKLPNQIHWDMQCAIETCLELRLTQTEMQKYLARMDCNCNRVDLYAVKQKLLALFALYVCWSQLTWAMFMCCCIFRIFMALKSKRREREIENYRLDWIRTSYRFDSCMSGKLALLCPKPLAIGLASSCLPICNAKLHWPHHKQQQAKLYCLLRQLMARLYIWHLPLVSSMRNSLWFIQVYYGSI